MRIAYLVSRHPVVSQAFLRREIEGLRSSGIDVETISIRRPRAEDLLGEADRADAATTYYVVAAGPVRLARSHLRALRSAPRRYLTTLGAALRLPGAEPRRRLWQLFYFAEAMILWAQLRDRGIRHVHAVQFADAAADVAMLAAEFDPRLSWSITVHGPMELRDPGRYRLADKLRSARLAVTVSEYGREQLASLVGDDRAIEVVYCGVDPDLFRPPEERDADGPARVLNVGRLVPQKDQSVLLEALAELRRRGVAARATIVGEGPERPRLEALAATLGLAEAVELAGAVPQDRILPFYGEADVFCLPSVAEAVPVALAEAMATGLPVVSTRAGGIPELVEDGVSGLLVEPGDPMALGDALERLIGDPDLRRRLGEAGRRRVEADFDSRRSARRLSELLRRTTTSI